jgi:hypothetical protein
MITIKKGLNILFAIVQVAIRIMLSYCKTSLNCPKPNIKNLKCFDPAFDIHMHKFDLFVPYYGIIKKQWGDIHAGAKTGAFTYTINNLIK